MGTLEKMGRKKYDDAFAATTDLAGVRVVCLYSSDLASIEEIIRAEFDVVEKIDKMSDRGTDRFGYGAVHFLVRLGRASAGARYDDLRDYICEIQTRTVLQDAWAIIDHHLAYKHEADVPAVLRRRLNGLAALFETADDQFDQIRHERNNYVAQIKNDSRAPATFLANDLNADTFRAYLEWKFPGLPLEENEYHTASSMFSQVDKGKYRTLRQLDDALGNATSSVEKLRRLNPYFLKRGTNAVDCFGVALAIVDREFRATMNWTKDLEAVMDAVVASDDVTRTGA